MQKPSSKASRQAAVPAQEQERLARLVRNAARAYTRGLQVRLIPHDVTYGHWSLLRALWAKDGLSQRELSAIADISDSTTSTVVKSLCALGYAEQRKLSGNNKNVHVFLTRAGQLLERKLVPLAEEINHISVQGLSQEDVQTTRRVLLAIIQTLASDEQRAEQDNLGVPSTQQINKKMLNRTAR